MVEWRQKQIPCFGGITRKRPLWGETVLSLIPDEGFCMAGKLSKIKEWHQVWTVGFDGNIIYYHEDVSGVRVLRRTTPLMHEITTGELCTTFELICMSRFKSQTKKLSEPSNIACRFIFILTLQNRWYIVFDWNFNIIYIKLWPIKLYTKALSKANNVGKGRVT
jgi:hypothetical protein